MALDGDALYVTTRFNGASRYSSRDGWRSFRAGASKDTSLVGNTFLFACLVDLEHLKWFGDWDGSLARFNDSSPIPQVTHFFDSDTSHFTWAWASAHDPRGNSVDKSKGVEKPKGVPAPVQRFDRPRLSDNESRRIREFRICI